MTSRTARRVRRLVRGAAVSAAVVAGALGVALPAEALNLGVEIVGSSLDPRGARVGSVLAGTAAVDAGLVPGDTITGLNGVHIESAEDFIDQIGHVAPGEWIALSFSGATGGYRAAVLPLDA